MITLPLSSDRWKFRNASARTARWHAAVVPGCVHRDLRGAGAIPDPFFGKNELALQWIEERAWEYRLQFEVPSSLLAETTVELVADGLDTVAVVNLNGHEVARVENMFIGYRWPVKAFLRPGRNELRIRFESALKYIRTHRRSHRPREFTDPVGRCQVLRKQQCQFGWDWGPRFVTAGIWRDIWLEAWSENRLETVRVEQHHRRGHVELVFHPELTHEAADTIYDLSITLRNRTITRATGAAPLRVRIDQPELWWPAGQGGQPLYAVEIVGRTGPGREIGRWARRIGLRTLVLDRRADRWGEAFRFVANGRPVFAKGANWISPHSFVAGLKREDYARDLRAAAAANMNMLRVWGGGIYESQEFYDLCDELGLMIWQDFMFACSIYPADAAFQKSVQAEALHQVRRLRHHACLALWCGNNEIAQLNADLLERPRLRADYDALFHQLLPQVVSAHDGVTSYWPTSQWRGDGANDHAAGAQRGDTHFWDVFHSGSPVKEYEKHAFRFVSEFGMQSYSSLETQRTFCSADDANLLGPTMESHQKRPGANQVMLDYVSRRYRFPKSQAAYIYLTQLNQAHCMQIAVEHLRRSMPRSMGALYWQLNDCWPVTSWSSIEFTGRWKALHHVARRFFAPALLTAYVPGTETTSIGNYQRSTVGEVHLYTVNDGFLPMPGLISWELYHLDGRKLQRGRRPVTLRPRESRKQKTLDLTAAIARHGADQLYLRIALMAGRTVLSEETVFLTAPRFLSLPDGPARCSIATLDSHRARLTFESAVFQHRFAVDFVGLRATSISDNYFELYPQRKKSVVAEFAEPVTTARIRRALKTCSLKDAQS